MVEKVKWLRLNSTEQFVQYAHGRITRSHFPMGGFFYTTTVVTDAACNNKVVYTGNQYDKAVAALSEGYDGAKPNEKEWKRDGGYITGPAGAYLLCIPEERRGEDTATASKLVTILNSLKDMREALEMGHEHHSPETAVEPLLWAAGLLRKSNPVLAEWLVTKYDAEQKVIDQLGVQG